MSLGVAVSLAPEAASRAFRSQDGVREESGLLEARARKKRLEEGTGSP